MKRMKPINTAAHKKSLTTAFNIKASIYIRLICRHSYFVLFQMYIRTALSYTNIFYKAKAQNAIYHRINIQKLFDNLFKLKIF